MLGAKPGHESGSVKESPPQGPVREEEYGHPVGMEGPGTLRQDRVIYWDCYHEVKYIESTLPQQVKILRNVSRTAGEWTHGSKKDRLRKYMTIETKSGKGLNRAALPMISLTIPIILENSFRILVSSVDTFMLSSWSQKSVAAVGLIGQYTFLIQILFNVICIGTSIVISQYLGAKRDKEAGQVTQASMVMVSLVAVAIWAAVLLGGNALLGRYSIEPEVREYAWQYLSIYGGVGAFFVAFSMLQGTILRSYGYTRDAMYISFAANIINVIGNSISLYQPFGIPIFGVTGVAISSVVSQVAACGLLAWRIKIRPDVHFPFRGISKVPAAIYRVILKIGVPTAGENLAYNTAQIVIMAMVSTFGTWAMSSMVYTQTIVRFVMVSAMSIGAAVQLKTGYFVGAKQPEAAYRRLYRYQAVGTLFSVSLILLVNLIKGPIIGIFTSVPEIMEMTSTLLVFSIYLEFGRSLNLVTISALKGAGDVKFPVLFGICSMWGIMVLGSYLFGVRAGFGLVGIWLSIGTDETIRGFVMLGRWKSKRWMAKALV